ncbi:interleukin 17a/f2 [Xiphias gladius]|uniref:interleukin 17a/f2 n=1 Tax=Xiphias gladius TaxID=8245 RepID=UPI001A9897F1|nr:interleukin 17a/f2 [Xiphias gladius]XP_039990438.1 interleukin 17a/f2 [Xiphias gladius]XP_039990447.1 interleukin 17a/f2 [Xiphias gladius]XP_039990456.1 interleukin 17a/f2 [Xiphias gladius]
MKLRHSICSLLVCCSVLWVVVSSSSRVTARPPPPPGCVYKLAFSSEVSSLSEGNGNIHSRSLSPWSWRSSTLKNRIPSTLWEAECSSSFCLSPNPGHTDKYDLKSVPIYQKVLVLNRQRGQHCYTTSHQSVAVGCTCLWARTIQN